MTIEIKKIDGKWLVNGKPYYQLSFSEMIFFDEFLRSVRIENEKVHDPNFNKPISDITKIYNI